MFNSFYRTTRTNGLEISSENVITGCDPGHVNIEIPSSVVSIRDGDESDYAFKNSHETLKTVSCAKNSELTYIGACAFINCYKLEEIDLSQWHNFYKIGAYAFANCYELRTFSLDVLLKNVQDSAFRKVPLNRTFDLSEAEDISDYAFINTSLSFTSTDTSNYRRLYENNIYTSDYSALALVSFSTTNLTIHPNTKTILGSAFSSTSLEEIIIPPQINSIAIYSLHLNDFIRTIVFTGNIKTITPNSIDNLPNLVRIHFPNGIENFQSLSILNCPKLKVIYIPSSLKNVESNAFIVPSLEYVTYKKEHFDKLLNGGIPLRALLHFRSACNQKPPFLSIFISLYLILFI